ncbi:MAG: DNA-processing protein DprA [Acidobacteria bacterium]|nr:DNA-processing protein DprA [Acidobacteriota bacterium]
MKPRRTEDLLGPLNEVEERHAPAMLYVQGHEEWLRDGVRVSVVGARDVSPDGVKRASRLARELVEADVTVVSGLALGVDATAHRSAIQFGGRTIAVLGTPLDKVYPRENAALQRLIGAEHLLVSQFAASTTTARHSFPLRNRTMALISHATVIIEASNTSGSLSQGWEALRLGRALFIARALFDRSDLTWPREMLNYGASVLQHTEDILEILPSQPDQLPPELIDAIA